MVLTVMKSQVQRILNRSPTRSLKIRIPGVLVGREAFVKSKPKALYPQHPVFDVSESHTSIMHSLYNHSHVLLTDHLPSLVSAAFCVWPRREKRNSSKNAFALVL